MKQELRRTRWNRLAVRILVPTVMNRRIRIY